MIGTGDEGEAWRVLEAPPGFEPGMEVLQTSALPLGDGADRACGECRPGPNRPQKARCPPSLVFGRALRWATLLTPSEGWSGKRDSNPRLRPWQGRTLPLSYSRPGTYQPETLPHRPGASKPMSQARQARSPRRRPASSSTRLPARRLRTIARSEAPDSVRKPRRTPPRTVRWPACRRKWLSQRRRSGSSCPRAACGTDTRLPLQSSAAASGR
jgi:hypothetical protein